jgi:UDP-N-acetylmuramate--alanine ligase
VPGRHNAENALAAATTGALLGVDFKTIGEGLAEFRGAERRQEVLGEIEVEGGQALVMDDYAHHPTEIRATISALRGAHPGRRLIIAFQPHLYSRTRDFLPEFAESLSQADLLIVTDVYAAREAPIPGVDAGAIIKLALDRRPGLQAEYIADRHEIPVRLALELRGDDLVIFMGAGDIREQGEALVQGGTALEVAK